MKEKKYYSIYLEIKKKILIGDFEAGQKLPSKRVMADKSGCSIITVERAYAMLEEEGYISTIERSGYFVSRIEATSNDISKTKAPTSHIKETHALPKNEDFEYSLWFKTLRRVISERGEELM